MAEAQKILYDKLLEYRSSHIATLVNMCEDRGIQIIDMKREESMYNANKKKMKDENEKMKDENEKLKAENEKLKAENEKLKAE
jgi:cell division protein FtsB